LASQDASLSALKKLLPLRHSRAPFARILRKPQLHCPNFPSSKLFFLKKRVRRLRPVVPRVPTLVLPHPDGTLLTPPPPGSGMHVTCHRRSSVIFLFPWCLKGESYLRLVVFSDCPYGSQVPLFQRPSYEPPVPDVVFKPTRQSECRCPRRT